MRRYGLNPYHLPGNMDIGDKPNPTVPAPWVRIHDLREWNEQFGRSWYSFDWKGIHFIGLNSQIMGGPLAEAERQENWLEADLARNAGKRVFIFMHMPPFFVNENEPGLGSYNCLDETPRQMVEDFHRASRHTGGERRLVTRLSSDLPGSPLGVNLRLPLAPTSPGVQAWPDAVRQGLRDDYPFWACLELGVPHLRLPAEDLDDLVQWNRLNLARKEGLGVTGVWLWHDELQLTEAVGPYRDRLEAVEIQVPGSLWTDDNCVSAIKSCSRQVGLPIALAPLKAQERTSGHFHPRTRVGYHSSDLAPLNRRLAEAGMYLDRVLCHLDANESAWEEVLEFIGHLPLSQIGNLDLLLSLSGFDEQVHAVATGKHC